MSEQPNDQAKKIFIDEDWKSKVQAEKEVAKQETVAQQEAAAQASGEDSTPTEPAPKVDVGEQPPTTTETPTPEPEPTAADSPRGPLPPPSLRLLAGGLCMQGMISLGLMPRPGSDKPEVDLAQAKHVIATLQMLLDKTEGNRTDDETQEMEGMLHEMRMAFLQVQQSTEQTSDA